MSFQFGDEEIFLWMEDSVSKYRNIYNKKINNPLKSYMDKADPIATVVKMISENIDKDNVLEGAVKNSTEKSFQNFHGKQWENLILLKEGWEEPPRLLDVAKKDRSIVVEIKNKSNTVKGSDLKSIYDNMEVCVQDDEYDLSIYTYIVPKNTVKVDQFFTPSDNKTKTKRPINKKIKELDGETFFNRYIFENDNGFSDFIDQMLQISLRFSDIFKSKKNSEFIDELRGLYNL